MTHHLRISSSQLAAGVVRSDSIWEMSASGFGYASASRTQPSDLTSILSLNLVQRLGGC